MDHQARTLAAISESQSRQQSRVQIGDDRLLEDKARLAGDDCVFIGKAVYLPNKGTTVANAERRMSRDIALNKPLTRIGTKESFAFVVMDSVYGATEISTALRKTGKSYVLGRGCQTCVRSGASHAR